MNNSPPDLPPSLDAKVPIDVARALAAILIGLSSATLAFLEGFFGERPQLVIPAALACTISSLSAARVVDWIMDQLDVDTWYRALNREDSGLSDEDARKKYENFAAQFNRWDDQFFFRCKIYGGGYLAFVLYVAIVCAFGVWYVGCSLVEAPQGLFQKDHVKVVAVLFGFYTSYQMLTYRSRGGTLAFAVAVVMIIMMPVLKSLGVL